MELKDYVEIVRKRWLVVAVTFVATTILTLLFVNSQPSLYESKATLVVRPRTSISEDAVRAVDTLSRRIEITSTYANIARSRLIKDQAIETLGLTPEERSGLKVTSKVITGSNLLEIGVRGSDPETVADFATAIGNETADYITQLDEAFELTVLDQARTPSRPMATNRRLTVALGGALGLVLGVGLAILVERLGWPVLRASRSPRIPRSSDRFNIIDRETNVYNEAYLLMRYDQELARSRRRGPVCLGHLAVRSRESGTDEPTAPSRRDLAAVVEAIQPTVRREDLLAHVGSGSFVVMLPEVETGYAEQLLSEWAESVAGPAHNGRGWIEATPSTIAFRDDGSGDSAEPESSEEPDHAPDVDDEIDDEPDTMDARKVMLQMLASEDRG